MVHYSVMNEQSGRARRAVPHAKAHPAGFETTHQLTRLALSGPSLRRKRHESAMSNVMNIIMSSGLRGAVSPGIEASIPMIQSTFPPFRAKSVHPSVNLPPTPRNTLFLTAARELGTIHLEGRMQLEKLRETRLNQDKL